MIVRKFGGSSLRDKESIIHIADIILGREDESMVVVLSALSGVTDKLHAAIDDSLQCENILDKSLTDLGKIHHDLIEATISDEVIRKSTINDIDSLLLHLGRLLKGVGYTNEATPRIKDEIMCIGERLAVRIMAGILRSRGGSVQITDNDGVSLIAHGEWGNGNAELEKIRELLPGEMELKFKSESIQLVTGYFGRTRNGSPITFGRGGSDYVAALYADALKAEKLEIWKDVDGFLSGSPEMVDDGCFLEKLSYDEAAELSYFGAKILHPRTVEPLLERSIPIEIRNTFRPDSPGTLIGSNGTVSSGVVKSVTFDRNVAMLRVHGVDVGYTVGLLSKLVSRLSRDNINIRSVMTSQTCINILLDRPELDHANRILTSLHPDGIDDIQPVEHIGLVAVVGEGLLDLQDSLSRMISALYSSGIHVDLIVSGASKVASYFIVPERYLEKAVQVVHKTLLTRLID